MRDRKKRFWINTRLWHVDWGSNQVSTGLKRRKVRAVPWCKGEENNTLDTDCWRAWSPRPQLQCIASRRALENPSQWVQESKRSQLTDSKESQRLYVLRYYGVVSWVIGPRQFRKLRLPVWMPNPPPTSNTEPATDDTSLKGRVKSRRNQQSRSSTEVLRFMKEYGERAEKQQKEEMAK